MASIVSVEVLQADLRPKVITQPETGRSQSRQRATGSL